MRTKHNAASHRVGIINSSPDPDLFSSLCGLASFVTNTVQGLRLGWSLTPREVSVLCSLLTSGAQISHLTLRRELPHGAAAQVGSAIDRAAITALTLGDRRDPENKPTPELLRVLAVCDNAALEQISIFCLHVSDGCMREPFGKFAALRGLNDKSAAPVHDAEPIMASGGPRCRVTLLVAGIGRLKALESLYIAGVGISDADVEALVAAVRDLPLVTDLGISSAYIGTQTGRQIGSLIALGRLRKLDMSFAQLNDDWISAVAAAISAPQPPHTRCELQDLNLGSNAIGPTGGEKLADSIISSSPRLRTLNLFGNPVGPVAALALGIALRRSANSLQELDVAACGLGSHGVVSLMSGLRGFPALRVLMIGWNCEHSLDARPVSRILLCPGLEKLGMQMNNITEAAALELAQGFVHAYKLRSLYVSKNPIGPQGASAILGAVAKASATMSMDTIQFADCGIGDEGALATGKLIEHRGCRCVGLSGNAIHAVGVKAIANSIADSAAAGVEELELARNPVGDEGVRYLLDKITAQGGTVRRVDVRETKRGVEAAMAVKRAAEVQDGMLTTLLVTRHSGNKKADKILGEIEKWERDSKPSGTAILELTKDLS